MEIIRKKNLKDFHDGVNQPHHLRKRQDLRLKLGIQLVIIFRGKVLP